MADAKDDFDEATALRAANVFVDLVDAVPSRTCFICGTQVKGALAELRLSCGGFKLAVAWTCEGNDGFHFRRVEPISG